MSKENTDLHAETDPPEDPTLSSGIEPTPRVKGTHGGRRPGAGRPKKAGKSDAYVKLAEERTRLAKAQRTRVELENRKVQGDLLPAAEVIQAWSAMIGAARTALLALPSRMAPELVSIREPAEIERRLAARVREILTDLGSNRGNLA